MDKMNKMNETLKYTIKKCSEGLKDLISTFDFIKSQETTEYFQYELKLFQEALVDAEDIICQLMPPTKFKVGDKVQLRSDPNIKGEIFGSVHLVPTYSITTRSWQVLVTWTDGIFSQGSVNINEIEKQTEGEVNGS